MKIFSEKVNYGLLALFELARNQHKGYIQIKEIAESQKIPQSYLEQLLIILKKAELVESLRGAQGGYKLKISANEIKIIDLIEILEGPIKIIDYDKITNTLQFYWKQKEIKFKEFFDETLEDLINQDDSLNKRMFYHI